MNGFVFSGFFFLSVLDGVLCLGFQRGGGMVTMLSSCVTGEGRFGM
jgi:hypothetical protein